jgi:8-oxo-dGTP pyrophosphatase MutT (NUDIX family)
MINCGRSDNCMDIDFKKGIFKFNARAAAIIYNNDKTKILLFKVEDGRDYYLLPGGRIEMYEDSASAIKREIKEELGFDLEYKLCSIHENFVEKNDKKITQYCFCYKAIYDGDISTDKIKCKDKPNQIFEWINVSDINKYKIYPSHTYELVGDVMGSIIHKIER